MSRFIFILSLLAVVISLTTCKAGACPLIAETRPSSSSFSASVLTNGGGGMPYYGPDPSLFPQPIPGAINRLTVPLPSAGGVLDFLQTLILGFVAFLVRRQTRMMES